MINQFRNARMWVKSEGGDVFPTIASFEWFVRTHRQELLESKQYIARKGSAGALVGPGIGDVVLSILSRECAPATDFKED